MLIGYDLDIVFGSGKAEGQCLPVADLDLINIHLDAAVLAVMAFYSIPFSRHSVLTHGSQHLSGRTFLNPDSS